MTDRDGDRDRERRAALRRFVRENHPDHGGDPEAFITGLERLRRGPTAGADPSLMFYRRQRGPARALRWWRDRHRAPRVR